MFTVPACRRTAPTPKKKSFCRSLASCFYIYRPNTVYLLHNANSFSSFINQTRKSQLKCKHPHGRPSTGRRRGREERQSHGPGPHTCHQNSQAARPAPTGSPSLLHLLPAPRRAPWEPRSADHGCRLAHTCWQCPLLGLEVPAPVSETDPSLDLGLLEAGLCSWAALSPLAELSPWVPDQRLCPEQLGQACR